MWIITYQEMPGDNQRTLVTEQHPADGWLRRSPRRQAKWRVPMNVGEDFSQPMEPEGLRVRIELLERAGAIVVTDAELVSHRVRGLSSDTLYLTALRLLERLQRGRRLHISKRLTEDEALALLPLAKERLVDLESGCGEIFDGETAALYRLEARALALRDNESRLGRARARLRAQAQRLDLGKGTENPEGGGCQK